MKGFSWYQKIKILFILSLFILATVVYPVASKAQYSLYPGLGGNILPVLYNFPLYLTPFWHFPINNLCLLYERIK